MQQVRCGHDTLSVNHELWNTTGTMDQTEKIAIWLNTGVPCAEPFQKGSVS
jgi:hypothetical protein